MTLTRLPYIRLRSAHIIFILIWAILVVAIASAPAYGQTVRALYYFGVNPGDPQAPFGVLIQGRDGNLYGVSQYGGVSHSGTVFKIIPDGSSMTVLHKFHGSDGQSPNGITLGGDGNFYGATFGGGASRSGTIFKIMPGGKFASLYAFTIADYPSGAPVQGTDGDFYGTTLQGSLEGTVYKTTRTGTLTTFFAFNGTSGGEPYSVIQAGDRNFYGSTFEHGANGCGTVFQLTPTGQITILHDFTGTDGCNGNSSLVEGSDGNFYGTTWFGGANQVGVVFQVTPAGVYTVIHEFGGIDGEEPTSLIQATDGNFYGQTGYAGTLGYGTIFRVGMDLSFSTIYAFDEINGAYPGTWLVQHTNGFLYGNASGGTLLGTFYRLDLGLAPFVSLVQNIGRAGKNVEILGQGLTGATDVAFNGIPASFTVLQDTYMTATVPAGATSGYVTVTTTGGTLTSSKRFVVVP